MGRWFSKPTLEQETERLKRTQIPIIWVIGSPGSGRTMQCNKLMDRYFFWKVSITQIIEDRVHHLWSKRGRDLVALLNRNELIPRDFLLEMLREDMLHYVDRSSGLLIDGFPRNIEQAKRFVKMTSSPSLILYLKCSVATAKKRLREKYPGRCSLSESDDSVRRRLQVFHSHVGSILTQYASRVVEVDAGVSPLEMNRACRQEIEKLFARLGIQVPTSRNEETVFSEKPEGEESTDDEDW